jgi:hypothetical protein
MSNRKAIDIDVALSFWARLTLIEQCSLAILRQYLLTPEEGRVAGPRWRKATRRKAAPQRPEGSFAASADASK